MGSWQSFVLSQATPDGEPLSSYSASRSFFHHVSRMFDRPTLDIDVVSHCNLNCACCYHFSPIADRSFLSAEELEGDLARLSRIEGVDGFFAAIGLMGGEPLLHPDLASLVLLTYRYLPHTAIRLWTNGILLEKAPDCLWDALSEAGATLYITPYPTDLDYAKLAALSESRGVRAVVGGGLVQDRRGNSYFLNTPVDPSGSYDPSASFASCPTGGSCLQLLGGRIYPCSKGALLGTLNRRFGTKMEHEQDDYLVLSDIRDVQEIEQFRRTFNPMCRYCAQEQTTRVAWERSRRAKSEWLEGTQGDGGFVHQI